MTASIDEVRVLMRALQSSDRDRAVEIRREMLERADDGLVWGFARTELAKYELDLGEYAAAAALSQHVLNALPDRTESSARGVAGVVLCDALESLDQAVSEALLHESIATCEATGELIWAAAGRMIEARRLLAAGERAGGKAALADAANLYNHGGAPVGGPEALLTLAKLEIEDGQRELALRWIDEALTHIGQIPLKMTSSRLIEKKLLDLRAALL